ncbi:MAG: lytic transglycosylase domain-containing protein [Motiliproteus sp.]|nr:lytic transglycosylase domain-containing protein [Motiliproteus sp.]MCW9052220.1 lytic transglycosylase domain-containing protein [Motiliproteus sp.]
MDLSNGLKRRVSGFAIVLVAVCFVLPVSSTAEVRKIVHPDGRIEYTNLSDQQRKIKYTGNKNVSTKQVYKYRDGEGVLSFSDQRPVNLSFKVLRFDCFACQLRSKVNWYTTPLNLVAYNKHVRKAANRYGVEEALVRAVIHAESAFKVEAISKVGAQGLMQLMPATAKELGVKNSLNAQQNIEGGTKYLATLLDNYSGNVTLATAAYNAGPGTVTRYKGVPPYAETEAYVKRVAILKDRYAKAL